MANLFPRVLAVDASGSIVGPEKPVRVQRSRKAGWQMPENTIYVGRPSKWGNPWRVDAAKESVYCDLSDTLYLFDSLEKSREFAVFNFRDALRQIRENDYNDWFMSLPESVITRLTIIERDIEQLRGKNLACWCPIDLACHADVLLELANSTRSGHLLDGVEVREMMEGE